MENCEERLIDKYLPSDYYDSVSEKNDEEIILNKSDKHLCFWVGIYCSLPKEAARMPLLRL